MADSSTFSSRKKDLSPGEEDLSHQSIPLDKGIISFILAVIKPFKGWVFVIFVNAS
ncbi:MAG: hypothetical protein GY915_09670 [bacterium]|nr:hypothetical protein [bacterium]